MDIHQQVEKILERVYSISDLRREHIDALRGLLVGKLRLSQVEAPVDEYNEWFESEGHLIEGFEYSKRFEMIVIECYPTIIQKTLKVVFDDWYKSFTKELDAKLPDRIDLDMIDMDDDFFEQSLLLDLSLSDECDDDNNRSIINGPIINSRGHWPIAAVDIGFCQPTEFFFKNAKSMLSDKGYARETVLILDVQESNVRRNWDPWGLSDDEIKAKADLNTLTEHILNWHNSRGYPLIGTFTASLYVYTLDKSNDPRVPFWVYECGRLGNGKYSGNCRQGPGFTRAAKVKFRDLFFDLPLARLETDLRNCLDQQVYQRAEYQARHKLNGLYAMENPVTARRVWHGQLLTARPLTD